MAKKGELKPMDAHEQEIRENAKYYNVILFQPATSSRHAMSFELLEHAKKYAEVTLSEPNRIRTAMIYAVNEYGNHAMMGSMDRDLNWKEVVPARYK